MGKFTDRFDLWFSNYVRQPIRDLKDSLEDKIATPLKTPLNAIKDKFTVLDVAIGNIRDQIIGVKDKIAEIPVKFDETKEKITEGITAITDLDFTENIRTPLNEFFDTFITTIFTRLKPNLIDEMKLEIAQSTINEDMFETDDMKQKIKELKERWAHSPESGSDIAHDLMDVVIGKVTKVQLEAVSGINIDDTTPVTNSLFNQMAIVTDITLATNLISVISEILSLGQVDKIGQELRSYMDYSGFSQISGYGYGMILSSALATPITQEINSKMLNMPVDPATLIRLKYKNMLPEAEYNTQMGYHGFGDTQRKAYEDDFLFYPTPQDLTHWISKEVFEPDSISKYGLLNEFENLDLDLFLKAGVSEEQVRNFWIAHWDAPSFTQVTQMLFRGLITKEDVYDWYRLVEISPFWRDKLTAIQYHPYTRVDIRRMFTAGVVDRETVKRTYLDLGYDEEKAENLTVWSTAEKLSKERDLTKTEILRLYSEGQLTTERAAEQVKALGYDEEESKLILLITELKRIDKEEKDLIATWTDLFKIHKIDIGEFEANLNELDITEIKKNRILAKAQRTEQSFITLPDKKDLKTWYQKKIISTDVFIDRMLGHGYSATDVANYLKELEG